MTSASVLSAIAFEFLGSKVEVHLQPLTFRETGNKFLMVLIDQKERFWTSSVSDVFVDNFAIVSDNQQSRITIVAEDIGPLVSCTYINADPYQNYGGMHCELSMPNAFKVCVYISLLFATLRSLAAN
jgi:hypothetical protein